MKIPTVERCCCFDLETGGKILGWLGIIFGGILSVIIFLVLIMVLPMSCEDITADPQLHQVLPNISNNCTVFKIASIIALIIILAMVLVSVAIDVMLVQGISSRNPGKIIPAVIIQGLGFVSTVGKGVLSFSGEGIFSAVIGGLIMFYFFIVLYSLYVKIRDEKKTVHNTQFSQP
ncbi:uncharacterized protein [Chironomus tepperi]|uniref:uncharacterized protein n=1 Tax=Chironomus tepperi TaxID=113505 RepID=UPI00391F49D5